MFFDMMVAQSPTGELEVLPCRATYLRPGGLVNQFGDMFGNKKWRDACFWK
ncbi:hypothetical protein [Paraburkholderia dilworthii]|uniref:hypothetical protein n=1 Tax=Paraburkholderia dilworthii TaxID=948106 RepID=UPI00040B485E